ncbi:MAG: carboxymuconolactone decarboxylase family protein [Actinomycetota bacterium]|nr:carboxymuconolactone decarboxylase family protein [Actinomycetota bacterium]
MPKVIERARAAMADQPVKAMNVVATMSHNRTVRDAIGTFCQTMLFNSELPRRQIEIAVLRMGWNCQSVYEFGQHTLFGLDAGLSEEEIYYTTRPISHGGWSAADASILQLVDDLYADDCVSDASWAAACENFSDHDVIHLLAAAGAYRVVSGFLNSAGVQLDEGVPGWPTHPGA